ncbi:hypothetical protein OIU84_015871 [Salix udensis]|uniref:Uncharacterized protein n=1 Tax=Salix udensis TaxID=889485 RepID=A0AAD6JA13_9ROSI|nr:hypothetical protein OIU84_015871 [Salix udensis]
MYEYDFIIGKPWLRAAIKRDLILLENQLPFFILEELYNHATDYYRARYPPFLDLSCHYFENYGKNRTLPGETKQCNPLHFTDLVRYFLSFKHPTLDPPPVGKQYKPVHFTDVVRYFLPFKHPKLEPPDGKQIKNPYSATMLHQAGIKFKPNLRAECLLDIRAWDDNENPVKKGELHRQQLEIRAWDDNEKPAAIKKGELHMPLLEIDNCTECLFRNLMALEQCHYPGKEFICRYVKLLDFLVDVEKDVDLLIENKVIVSRLGDSKAVAKLINKLCLEIVEVTSGYDALSELLNNYHDSSWNKNKAYLVSVYFQNVWIGTGTVVGLIILAITVTRFILFFFR